MPFRDGHTWYRVVGDVHSGYAPVVVMHGGPGSVHDYLRSLEQLADTGRPVVFYDQIGNGRSSHHPEHGAGHWTPQLFLDELDALIDFLGISSEHVLLGQSWGGMLAAEYAVRRPAGLKGLVIVGSPASMPLWLSEAARLRAKLPEDVQEVLLRHELAGTTDDPEYDRAAMVYYGRHVCRLPFPPRDLLTTMLAMKKDPTVYHHMNGPNDFHVIGTIKDWTIVDRLDRIDVPTLLLAGVHDEATPTTMEPFYDRIRDVDWVLIEDASHMPHLEQPAEFFPPLERFLRRID